MSPPWRLTRQAEASLVEIALWTLDRFGPLQAERYEAELIARCQAIADGTAITYDCSLLGGEAASEELRFARAGERFVVFAEIAGRIAILDFLHQRTDLPRRLRDLAR